jgi:hypothetical protein
MEVDRFKHWQLAPTVGRSSRSLGELKGPISKNQSVTTRLLTYGQLVKFKFGSDSSCPSSSKFEFGSDRSCPLLSKFEFGTASANQSTVDEREFSNSPTHPVLVAISPRMQCTGIYFSRSPSYQLSYVNFETEESSLKNPRGLLHEDYCCCLLRDKFEDLCYSHMGSYQAATYVWPETQFADFTTSTRKITSSSQDQHLMHTRDIRKHYYSHVRLHRHTDDYSDYSSRLVSTRKTSRDRLSHHPQLVGFAFD